MKMFCEFCKEKQPLDVEEYCHHCSAICCFDCLKEEWCPKCNEGLVCGKAKDGSFLHNCDIQARTRDIEEKKILFRFKGPVENCESIMSMLNGYAVIPIEDYMKLKGATEEEIKTAMIDINKCYSDFAEQALNNQS